MVERGKGGRGAAGVVQVSSLSHACLHLVTGRWWAVWKKQTVGLGGRVGAKKGLSEHSNAAFWILPCPGLPNPMRYKSNGWKISELGDREHVGWPASLTIPALLCEEGGRAAVAASPPVTALCWLSREPYSAPLPARWHTLWRTPTSTRSLSAVSAQCAQMHTRTPDWRAAETAQGPSGSHGGCAPSHSLDSVPPRQYALRGGLGDTLLTMANI